MRASGTHPPVPVTFPHPRVSPETQPSLSSIILKVHNLTEIALIILSNVSEGFQKVIITLKEVV